MLFLHLLLHLHAHPHSCHLVVAAIVDPIDNCRRFKISKFDFHAGPAIHFR